MRSLLLTLITLGLTAPLRAQTSQLDAEVDRRAAQVAGLAVDFLSQAR